MQPPPDAVIVDLIQTPTPEITIVDVLIGSFGIVGALVLLAVLLGAALSLLLVVWHKRHPPEDDHMPAVAPIISPERRQSSRAQ